MKETGKELNIFGNSFAANIPTTLLDKTGTHRTMHCSEFVFIFLIYDITALKNFEISLSFGQNDIVDSVWQSCIEMSVNSYVSLLSKEKYALALKSGCVSSATTRDVLYIHAHSLVV